MSKNLHSKKLNAVAIIPARMESSRFPGKPLVPVLGMPMVEHIWKRIKLVEAVSDVFVATCDEVIRKSVTEAGGKVIMTSATHRGATDRVEEAARSVTADIIMIIQGDEPMVTPEMVTKILTPFERPDVLCTNMVCPIRENASFQDPNIVKVVLSNSGRMMYLSRAPIPGRPFRPDGHYYKQTGYMAYRKQFLHQYCAMSASQLEIHESIDILRVLQGDYFVQGVIHERDTIGVDLPEHVRKVENAILNDPAQKALWDAIQ